MPAVIEDDFLGGVVFEFVYVGVDEDHRYSSFIGPDFILIKSDLIFLYSSQFA